MILQIAWQTHEHEDAVDNDKTTANCETDRDHVVKTTRSVEVVCQRPRRGIGVVRLHSGTTPGRVTVAVDEQISISIDDANHDCVIDETTEDSAVYLSEEHDTRRNFHYSDGQYCIKITNELHQYVRYSPIFKSLHSVTALEMTLCDPGVC